MSTRIPLRTTDTKAKDLAEKLDMSTAEIGLSVRTWRSAPAMAP